MRDNGIDHLCRYLSGIAFFSVRTYIGKCNLIIPCDLAFPFYAAEAFNAAMHMHAPVVLQGIILALKVKGTVRHTADKSAQCGAEKGRAMLISGHTVIPQYNIPAFPILVRDEKLMYGSAQFNQGNRHHSIANDELFYTFSVLGIAENIAADRHFTTPFLELRLKTARTHCSECVRDFLCGENQML